MDAFNLDRQVVLILVGLVGSGKSTFAQALEQHLPTFKRCNQDELGRRQQVEWLTRDSLGRGFSVCIDRTNFDPQQRATWIDIAREYSAEAWVIHFDTPPEICAARILTRTDHPTIHTPEKGLEVLARFRASFVPPSPHEGYARLLVLAPADHPDPTWSRAELAALLARVPVAQPATNLHRFFRAASAGAMLLLVGGVIWRRARR